MKLDLLKPAKSLNKAYFKQSLIREQIELFKSELLKTFNHIDEKQDPQTYRIELEKEIDEMVYKLYELTYEEVKVVDPDFSLTGEEYNQIRI